MYYSASNTNEEALFKANTLQKKNVIPEDSNNLEQ